MASWTCVIPQFGVRDVPAAQRWYRDVLGLEVNWLWEEDFGSVGRDLVEIFLYKDDDPKPSWCSVFVDDVDAVYDAVRRRGGDIESELENKPWNVREFTVRDPDCNSLRIGRNVESPVERPEISASR
jgi:catechol 2,3-dioxygenase-like lactoylglutathione lyase family enzyme